MECAICGKKTARGNSVSHAHNKTRRTWKPNLKPARVLDKNKKVIRIKVCMKCFKAGKVLKAV